MHVGKSNLLLLSVCVVSASNHSCHLTSLIQVAAMIFLRHLGAVLALSCLVSMTQTEETPLQGSSRPPTRALFLSYSSDGDSLTSEQLRSLLSNEFSQVQALNDQLLEEFMVAYDVNGDDKLDMMEFADLVKFITKDGH
ncbi:hypothetical protein J4Q44_G00025130 [Coregonus suidteri]|uniref:EF-hand domain-containing protein n=1 Tax=Coregonus suidteri TaxID=861788 RepID=A0AAN8R7G0_9TELE